MSEVRVSGDSNNIRVDCSKLINCIREGNKFSRTHISEVEGVEHNHEIFSCELVKGYSLKFTSRSDCYCREEGSFLSGLGDFWQEMISGDVSLTRN